MRDDPSLEVDQPFLSPAWMVERLRVSVRAIEVIGLADARNLLDPAGANRLNLSEIHHALRALGFREVGSKGEGKQQQAVYARRQLELF